MKKWLVLATLLMLMGLTLPLVAQNDVAAANKDIVTRFGRDFWSGGDQKIADQIIAKEFVAHFTNGPDENWATYLTNTWSWLRTALPDMTIKPTVLLADGNMVATALLWGGTFSGGEKLGLKPTGQQVWVSEIDFFRIENGKIKEFWAITNSRSFSEQMGLVEPKGKVTAETAWNVKLATNTVPTADMKMRLLTDALATNSHNVDQILIDYSPTAKLHWLSGATELEGQKALRESWDTTPPQHRIAPRLIVAEGNLTATLYTMFPYVEGVPGLRTEMAVLNRFEGDKMVEEWAIWDDMTLANQIAEASQ